VSTIVVGYDGSEPARRALERAAELARGRDGSVLVVGAVGVSPASLSRVPGEPVPDAREDLAVRDALEEARATLAARGVAVETVEEYGDPADAVIARAKAAGADLIVVGARGLGLAGRALLGSVSSKIVHNAGCDVLVVR
jgi:nucleotide-binding universal stress UspA family protein